MRSQSIAFVAMSGVRIQDSKLLELGMTLPGFVERGKVIALLPSLGLLTLAGLTPADWPVSYHEVDLDLDAKVQELANLRPDLVAISSLTARIDDAYRLADALRAEGIRVALGGLHASVLPKEAAQHADAVVVGEGESAWPQLLRDMDGGAPLQPIYRPTKGFSLASAPLPRFDLLNMERYNRLTIQSTRGCPLGCAFCGASRLISEYKRKPIDLIRREIEAVLSIWDRPFLELADDNTFLNRRWSLELLQMMGEYPLRWFTETDLRIADDPERLELLARSGCAQVLIGLESGNPDSLGETDPKGWKRRRQDRYKDKVAAIQQAGISVNGCFIVGFDHDSPDVFEETKDLIAELDLAEVQITILTPFPGTELAARLSAEGRLLQPRYWDRCTLFDVAFRPALMSPDELRQGFRWLAGGVYSDRLVARRRASFVHAIRQGKRDLDP